MNSPRRRGQRAGLDPAAILSAARQLSAEEGVGALTMRRLAARLGVTPNSLYSYYPDKPTLLATLVDGLLAGVTPADPAAIAWRDGLVALMGDCRRVLVAHAELIPIFLAGPARGPNGVRLAEGMLALLAAGGVTGQAADDSLQVLLIYTFGFAAHAGPHTADPARATAAAVPRTRFAFEAAADAPRSRAVTARLAGLATDATFEMGLRWLLDGIGATGAVPPAAAEAGPQPAVSGEPARPPRPTRSGRFR